MTGVPEQLGLAISLREETRFANFVANNQKNRETVAHLSALALPEGGAGFMASDTFFLWGGKGVGLSHLLQASCHHLVEHKFSAQYLPIAELLSYPAADVCEGLERCDLVGVDDIDAIQGHTDWQRALFNLFNRLRENQGRFICASHFSPAALPVDLPDLKSRLLSGASFQVQALDEAGLVQAFKARAEDRGLEINDDVTQFIFSRLPRSTHFLFGFLDELDRKSLAEKRKVTVPFVRDVLNKAASVG